MDPSLQALLQRLEHLSDQFRELREGVQKAVHIADADPEMALTRARKVLEYIVRDVYERRLREPPGTRPLEGLLQRLVREGHFPDRLDAYANTIRKLGNVGTHSFGEKVTVADVHLSLTQLLVILEWYFEEERPEALGRQTAPAPPTTPVGGRPNEESPVPAPPPSVTVVPKGLRSFDAHDADFFLTLLPGARDREGLPESIRFWKHRIEAQGTPTFTVGVLYGPSGCGKSSLIKAGLLPRLAGHVCSVYVEATAEDTEARLLNGLRKRYPGLAGDLDLTGTLAALRQAKGKKVLLILDQFEQWLHARRGEEDSELVRALRQCDGDQVQGIVLVRDDYWMGLTRFLQELQIELLQGQNAAPVDLFDLRHAKKVLTAFGQAFGALPKALSKEQGAFLDQAVQGLSQDGRVICVRLALFAEMVKGRPWTPATWKEVGGMEGVGVSFLEETFAATTAPPQYRLHQRAAQGVLKALLPETGTDIKGNMRSQDDLLAASGYASRPRDFESLLRILDAEVRLITPADLEGKGQADPSTVHTGTRYYQLTHDYLVPSLRQWLTRKQKETRRGRAELLLADRAAVWNARPENRQLPSLLQWLRIRWYTRKKQWTPLQRRMIAKAGRVHAVRGCLVATMLAMATLAGLTIRERVVEHQKATQAQALVDGLVHAETAQVPALVEQLADYRPWADPLLREVISKAADSSRQKLHSSLALLPVDATQVDYLYGRLLDAQPQDVPVIRDALAPHQDRPRDRLWAVAEKPERGKEAQRLRAAAALAQYDLASAAWAKFGPQVVHDLVRENPVYLGQWSEAFRPVQDAFLPPLAAIFRDRNPDQAAERSLATNLLADYAAGHPTVLADLLLDAEEKQFTVLYPKFKDQSDRGVPLLTAEIDKKLPVELPSSDPKREALAKRQANAAVALLGMDRPEKVWPLLKRTPPDDPRVRSYLIHRLSPLGADAGAILRRLDEEPDVTIRRALLLSIGKYGEEGLPAESRPGVLAKVQALYRSEEDPGLHAAAEWLLRQWQQGDWLKQMNEDWAKDKEGRDRRSENIQELVKKDGDRTPPQWYVNSLSQTMVVIPGPVEFLMGSPLTEEGRQAVETQHPRRIGRTYALAAKAVTVREFRPFLKDSKLEEWFEAGGQAAPLMKRYSPGENGPVILVDWYRAAEYCNWLSRQDGIPEDQWCYETDARKLSQERVSVLGSLLVPQDPLARAAGARYLLLLLDRRPQVTAMRKGYLGLRGYRLPTEAEWEYACRAGAVTSWYYGETEELLAEYGWYQKNGQERTWPVGGKKPNDLGLFDLHGNVWNWCQGEYRDDYAVSKGGKALEDEEDSLQIVSTNTRVLRGGSFGDRASVVRCALRGGGVPTLRDDDVGFRPARTLPLDGLTALPLSPP
jgi:formylglycine-generating enzyme required for sulfatase activity